MRHRVAITGLGICTSIGCGVEAFWENLVAGRSGISEVTVFDAHALPVRIGGEVKNLNLPLLVPQFPQAAGERDRKIWLGLEAAKQALIGAGLDKGNLQEALIVVGVSLETFFLDDVSSIGRAANSSSALREILQQTDVPRLQTPLDQLFRASVLAR